MDKAGLLGHIDKLNLRVIDDEAVEFEAMLREMDARGEDDYEAETVKGKAAASWRRRHAWVPVRRKVALVAVVAKPGEEPGTPGEQAEVLRDHWQQTFRAKLAGRSKWARFDKHLPRFPPVEEAISEEKFMAMVASKRDTAAGPDGIPYAAYMASHGIGGRIVLCVQTLPGLWSHA